TSVRFSVRTPAMDGGRSGLNPAMLSPNIIVSCEDFLTQRTQRSAQRDAKRSVLCGLCEILGALCVESGDSGVWLRLRRAALLLHPCPSVFIRGSYSSLFRRPDDLV